MLALALVSKEHVLVEGGGLIWKFIIKNNPPNGNLSSCPKATVGVNNLQKMAEQIKAFVTILKIHLLLHFNHSSLYHLTNVFFPLLVFSF